MTTTAFNESPALPPEPLARLSVEQYHAMQRAGIIGDEDRLELLDGWLVKKMTIHPWHAAATERVAEALRAALPPEWRVRTQQPISLAQSEPEPDVAVVRADARYYADRHPGAADVALVVEVADATLQRDRTTKLRLYAEAGIPVYWIVNLPERLLEVYTQPSGAAERADYHQHQAHAAPQQAALVIAGGEITRLAVARLLP